MGRRDRTHIALQEAALELFAERGYDATTTALIAQRAGVSEMTLFRHFPAKESLLLEDPYDPFMADGVRARPADEPPMRALVEGIRSAWNGIAPPDVAVLRRRLRIAASTSSLQGALERNSGETASALSAALQDRGVPAAAARIAAAAVLAGLSKALLDWAQGDETDLHAALERALHVLGGR